jgi:hypothetical protein
MNTPSSIVTAVVAGFVLPLLTPVPSLAAPLPSAPLPQKVTLDQTKHADVDGDGHRDTIRLYTIGTHKTTDLDYTIWKAKATTATGKTSSVTFEVPTYQGKKLWYGWAKVDGHKGAEVLLAPSTDDYFVVFVLTWQAGKLRIEKSPVYPGEKTHYRSWSGATEDSPSGFTLLTKGGKRYVDAWRATCPDSGTGSCTVKTQRSVWKKTSWKAVGAVVTTKVSVAKVWARDALGGVTIHK